MSFRFSTGAIQLSGLIYFLTTNMKETKKQFRPPAVYGVEIAIKMEGA